MTEPIAGLTLPQVARLAQTGLELWLLALALVVGWRLFVEGNALQGILATRAGAPLEPDRLQMMMAAAGGVIMYAVTGAQAVQQGAKAMPDAPVELLVILGASQAIYLGGKFGRLRS